MGNGKENIEEKLTTTLFLLGEITHFLMKKRETKKNNYEENTIIEQKTVKGNETTKETLEKN